MHGRQAPANTRPRANPDNASLAFASGGLQTYRKMSVGLSAAGDPPAMEGTRAMTPNLRACLVMAAVAVAVTATGCGGSPAAPRKTITVTASPSASQPTPSATPQPTVAPSASGPATSATVTGCLSRYLHGATGLTQGTAGSVYVVITFKNLDNVPCTLYGFPGVAQAAGSPVTDIGLPSVESSSSARELVTLQPGGYAYATLQIVDAGNFPSSQCTQVPATWLAVIPPNQRVPLYIPYQSVACKGTAQLLIVTAVQPGNGGSF